MWILIELLDFYCRHFRLVEIEILIGLNAKENIFAIHFPFLAGLPLWVRLSENPRLRTSGAAKA